MGDKEDVRSHLDIVDFIGQRVVLKSSGRNFKGLCPFHQEKSPSFMVSPERQSFKCFGCGEGGDIFAFYMRYEGVTFAEALKDLAEKAGITLTNFSLPADFLLKQKLLEINILAAKFYHFLLAEHALGKKAQEYLLNRGVTLTQIKDFQIGYAPDNWRSLTGFLSGKKRLEAEDIEKTGLILKSTSGWYDRFRGRVMFPLTDTRGNIVGFSGRVLPWTQDDKSGKYINTPETLLYHKSSLLYPFYQTKEAVREKNSVVVVEGELDVLASLRAGVKNVVAVKGSALTADQVRLMRRYCETIILALDSDEAGINAAKRAITVAQEAEMNVKVVELSQGKDPDELVKSNPSLWRQSVKAAVDIYDFFLNVAKRQKDVTTVEGKQAVTKIMMPLLNQIQNKVIQAHYVKKLAKVLSVDDQIIEEEMHRQAKKTLIGRPAVSEAPVEKSTATRIDLMLEELLSLVIHGYQQLNFSRVSIEDFPQDASTQILNQLITQNPQDIIEFPASLQPQLQQQFDHCFLKETEELDDKILQERVDKLISEVAKLSLRDRLTELRNKLKQASKEDKENFKHQINNVLVQLRRYNN